MVDDVKENGYVIVAVPNFFSPDLIHLWSKYGKGNEVFYSKGKMRSLLTNSGLLDVQVATSSFCYPSFMPSSITKFESVESFLGEHMGLGFLVIGSGRKFRR